MVTRSVAKRWVSPPARTASPQRSSSPSNAAGQSSSTPRRRPITWVLAMLLLSEYAAAGGGRARVGRVGALQGGLDAQRSLERGPDGVADHGAQAPLLELVEGFGRGAAGRGDHVAELGHVAAAVQGESCRA